MNLWSMKIFENYPRLGETFPMENNLRQCKLKEKLKQSHRTVFISAAFAHHTMQSSISLSLFSNESTHTKFD